MNVDRVATTRLLLVRHGQTKLSHENTFCGVTEAPLTTEGHRQAEYLAEHFRHELIDAIYCSPQTRAQETALPIARALGLELQTRAALREMNFGLWEKRIRTELAQEYPQALAAWERGSWMAHPPEGETQQEVIARVVTCVTDLLNTHTDQTILLVGHKSALRLLMGNMLNMSLPTNRSLRLDPASISELRVMGDHAQLIRYNDTAHLTKPEQRQY
jgi:broad specificity phosphatase PhoE